MPRKKLGPFGKTLLGGAFILSLAGGLDHTLTETKRDCETYQGWSSHDGKIVYTFDSQGPGRNSSPEYTLTGNSKLIKNLEIGNDYCFNIETPPLDKLLNGFDRIKDIREVGYAGKVR